MIAAQIRSSTCCQTLPLRISGKEGPKPKLSTTEDLARILCGAQAVIDQHKLERTRYQAQLAAAEGDMGWFRASASDKDFEINSLHNQLEQRDVQLTEPVTTDSLRPEIAELRKGYSRLQQQGHTTVEQLADIKRELAGTKHELARSQHKVEEETAKCEDMQQQLTVHSTSVMRH